MDTKRQISVILALALLACLTAGFGGALAEGDAAIRGLMAVWIT